MSYVPNAADVAEPTEARKVESAALEFRTLKTQEVRGLRFPAADLVGNRGELPTAANRAGRFLAFDSITGVPIVGPLLTAWTITQLEIASIDTVAASIASVNTVAANTANINAVAADAADIGTVAANIVDVVAVGDNIASVVAVAANEVNINAAVADLPALAAKVSKTGDTMTGNLNVPSLNGGQLAGMRNKIINGKMVISQRGDTFAGFGAAQNGSYTIDRWWWNSLGTTVATVTQQVDAPADNEFSHSLRVSVTTADASMAAGDVVAIDTALEGWNVRDLIGRAFTLSFRVRSSVTGTYCVSFVNSGDDRSFVVAYTVTSPNTWETKTIAVPAGLITAGTWDWGTGKGLVVRFCLAAGSSFQTAANAWQVGNFLATANQVNSVATIGNIFAITGVQLEAGSVATPFEHRHVGVEYAMCQRYLQYIDSNHIFLAGYTIASTAVGYRGTFTVPMRATPGLSTSLTFAYSGTVAGASISASGPTGYRVSATAGGQYILEASGGAAVFTAEL